MANTPPPTSANSADENLLGELDGPAFEIFNADGQAPVVIVSDHASNAIPRSLGDLGIASENFEKHIAYDIGADMVTRLLAERIDAPAVIAKYSRLVIDLNRQPGDPHSVPEVSDGVNIPGNCHIGADATNKRLNEIFTPYHGAVDGQIMELWKRHNKPPLIFSIHSFTPNMNGENRLWDIGVLWNLDPRMAKPLIKNLKTWPGLNVGDNEPYSGRDLAYTIDHHGSAGGIATCAVEIRQDHCADIDEASHWADILAGGLKSILRDPNIHQVARY